MGTSWVPGQSLLAGNVQSILYRRLWKKDRGVKKDLIGIVYNEHENYLNQ